MTGDEPTGEGDSVVSPTPSPSASPRPTPAAEPSWPRVLATTIQLWLKRRRRRTLLITLVVVAALAAGAAVLATQRGTSRGGAHPGAAHRPPTPAATAATWVAGQIDRSETVACDPAMCTTLARDGFPAANLAVLRAGSSTPPGAGLVVITAAARATLGSRLASWSAPVTLASFGTGRAAVQVKPVTTQSPAAYLRRFLADFAARKNVGAELLGNKAITASATARQQLAAGDPDPRLISSIALLATAQPVHLVSFGDASPGASQDVPLRSALLYPRSPSTAALRTLLRLLTAQRPASVSVVRLPGGRDGLSVRFAAPSPLSLLSTSQPLVKISAP